MSEASKISDLFKLKSMFRYWKKGIVYGFLYGLVWTIINAVITAITKSMGVPTDTLMGAIQVGGIAVAVTILIGLVLQGIIAGFLVEFINNNSSKLIRWVRK